ncbi:2TM domain-containing protein [Bacteroides ihuae]|uniref:2TM domain-containing protein n=1 Tax=Bacteroides ihuae TaxID=1852362 RepID=UPI0008DA8B1A|nr:2TM domain-containing protein [Bacteroides ihuae]
MELVEEKKKMKTRFSLHLKMSIVKYIVINVFLVVVNWLTCPHYWWVLWVIAGWGVGLSLNLLSEYMEYKINKE